MGLHKKHFGLSGNALLACLTLVNGLTMGWFGYDQGVFSGVLISSDFKYHFPETLDANISGITSSCFSLGAFIGCLVAFAFGDKLGRRKTIMVGSACNTIGAVLQIAAFHLPMMIIGRIINGFGMGMTSSTCPVYQAECTKAKYRGRLVVVGSLSNTFAYMLANWMNYGLYFSSGPLQWRFPLAFQLLFPIISVPILCFLPESPRWLLNKGRTQEGLSTIALLWGKNLEVTNETVQDEYLSILDAIEQERLDRVPFKDVIRFRDKTQNMRRILLGMGTQFMQQFTGVNALGYYLPTILTEQLGFTEAMAKLLSACNATSYLGSAFVCLIIIDLVGRRRMMIYGSVGCCITYIVAAASVKVSETRLAYEMGALTVSMFFLYYVIYGTSYAKVPWVYSSEINSIGWRTRGAAAATATNWICGFCITQYTKKAVNNLGWGFYLLFAFIVLCYVPVVICLYPETSRRSLEDLDYMFIQYPSPVVFRHKALTQRGRPEEFVLAEKERILRGENLTTKLDNDSDRKSATITHVERV
ncbi:hypothetical protein LJB42_003282 [Komagataella kurtzmanii]|nr:hypothetical protein LJB42_003282 [Komagataella kurtzmanii]